MWGPVYLHSSHACEAILGLEIGGFRDKGLPTAVTLWDLGQGHILTGMGMGALLEREPGALSWLSKKEHRDG